MSQFGKHRYFTPVFLQLAVPTPLHHTFSFAVRHFTANRKGPNVLGNFKTRCFGVDNYATHAPFIFYKWKKNTSRFTELIGRNSKTLKILEVRDKLFEYVLKNKYFQLSITEKFCYVLNNMPQFKKYIAFTALRL